MMGWGRAGAGRGSPSSEAIASPGGLQGGFELLLVFPQAWGRSVLLLTILFPGWGLVPEAWGTVRWPAWLPGAHLPP